jgi:hypothetical protein
MPKLNSVYKSLIFIPKIEILDPFEESLFNCVFVAGGAVQPHCSGETR